jgi:hypothetical protein
VRQCCFRRRNRKQRKQRVHNRKRRVHVAPLINLQQYLATLEQSRFRIGVANENSIKSYIKEPHIHACTKGKSQMNQILINVNLMCMRMTRRRWQLGRHRDEPPTPGAV